MSAGFVGVHLTYRVLRARSRGVRDFRVYGVSPVWGLQCLGSFRGGGMGLGN